MTARDSSSSLLMVGLGLLVVGVIGAIITYKQSARSPHQVASAQSPEAEKSIGADSKESASTRSTGIASAALSVALPTGVSSSQAVPNTRLEIDWESLIERTPEAALQQLKVVVPRDEPEAQRFGVYEVRALTKLQRIGEAHAQAEAYFERWPSGPDIVYLQGLTGAHPRR